MFPIIPPNNAVLFITWLRIGFENEWINKPEMEAILEQLNMEMIIEAMKDDSKSEKIIKSLGLESTENYPVQINSRPVVRF